MTIPQPALPATWRWQPFDSLSRVKVSTVDKKSYPDEVPVRLCNYTDVYYQDVITSDLAFMEATASAEQVSRFTVRAGDVAITKDSETPDDIGRPSYVPEDLPGVVYGYHLAIYQPLDPNYSKFIRYLFDSSYIRAELQTRTPGVTRVGLSQDTLRNLRVPTPPPYIAAEIADYLDHETAEIDAFIADQTLFKKLVTEYFHSFLTEIYASRTLSTRRLKDFGVTKVSGVSVNGSSEPARDSELGVLKTGSVSKGYFDASENKAVLDPAEMERLKTPVRAGHLIVNRANTPDLVGSLAPVFHDFPHLFLSDLLWQLKFKKVDPNYIYWYSKTRKFRDQISLIKVGASQTMQKIRFEDFARLEIPFMSFEDQRSILTKASEEGARVQQVARLVGQAIDLARERRAALITAAVTGQIDVTAKNKPAAEQLEDDIAQGLHREYA